MRILTGSLIQETNTFSPVRSDLALFAAGCLLYGEESLSRLAGTRTELGGFIAASAAHGVELIPTLAAWASSGGRLRQPDFEELRGDLLQRMREAGPVDGVLFALHGAWTTEACDDADGAVIEDLRCIVGPDVPIVLSLDLHANITLRMLRHADALVGFRTYPHLDMYETGTRAADLLFTLLRTGRRARTVARKIPMILPPENAQTTSGPVGHVMDQVANWDGHGDVISSSLFTVQPWLDVEELGCTVLCVTTGNFHAVQQLVDDAARTLWDARHDVQVPLIPPDVAVHRALAAHEGPVLLIDSADGVSSGSPGDSTAILRPLVAAHSDRLSLVTLVDPKAAHQAAQSDGETVTLEVGATLDPQRHTPVVVTGRSRRVADGRVTYRGGIGDGLTSDMGTAAVLEAGGLRLLLMEYPVACYDPVIYRAAGLEPADAQLVVVKSPNNFRWTYRDIAREWIYVDAPGASTPRLASLPFTRAPRPLYPLDDWDWRPET